MRTTFPLESTKKTHQQWRETNKNNAALNDQMCIANKETALLLNVYNENCVELHDKK